jgi:hypothetical protein
LAAYFERYFKRLLYTEAYTGLISGLYRRKRGAQKRFVGLDGDLIAGGMKRLENGLFSFVRIWAKSVKYFV